MSKRKELLWVTVAISTAIILTAGCKDLFGPREEEKGTKTVETVYVVKSGQDDTISTIDPTNYAVSEDVLTIRGDYGNAIEFHDGKGYIVVSDLGIQVFDPSTNADLGAIDVGTGTNPWDVAFSGSKAYVSQLFADSVAVVDLTANSVIKTIPVGKGPEGMVVANRKLYVANTGFDLTNYTYGPGTVSVIDTATDEVATTVTVGTNPQAIAANSDGSRIYVVNTGDYFSEFGTISVVDTGTDSVVATIEIGGSPQAIAIAPNGKAYVTDSLFGGDAGLMAFDTTNNSVLYGYPNYIPGTAMPDGLSGIAITKDGTAFVCDPEFDVTSGRKSQVIVLDTESDTVKKVLKIGGVGGGASAVAVYSEEVEED
ncbi:MAG: hypothetical protein ACUVXI_07285 [bacterium]